MSDTDPRPIARKRPRKEISTSTQQLYSAVQRGQIFDVKALLESDAARDIDFLDNKALRIACLNGHVKIASVLIEAGAAIESTSGKKIGPLHYACAGGHYATAHLLLRCGASASARDWCDFTPLHRLCNRFQSSRDDAELAKLLIDYGAEVNVRNDIEMTPLMSACMFSKAGIVRVLCEHGADKRACDPNGMTNLHYAARLSNGSLIYRNIMKCLLSGENGADVNAVDEDGQTALDVAADCESLETGRLLIEFGANAVLHDSDGRQLIDDEESERGQFLRACLRG